jgi:CheY-like chemotaxis protein
MVDDNEIDLRITQKYYQKSGIKNNFLTLSSGTALIEYLSNIENNEGLPSLVLLDINMPEMNGFQCLKAIREQNLCRDNFLIIAFSNSDSDEDIAKAIKLGAHGYQTKPYSKEGYLKFFASLVDTEN